MSTPNPSSIATELALELKHHFREALTKGARDSLRRLYERGYYLVGDKVTPIPVADGVTHEDHTDSLQSGDPSA